MGRWRVAFGSLVTNMLATVSSMLMSCCNVALAFAQRQGPQAQTPFAVSGVAPGCLRKQLREKKSAAGRAEHDRSGCNP